jgi:hypothetical protein
MKTMRLTMVPAATEGSMRRILYAAFLSVIFCAATASWGQSKRDDIPVTELPATVKTVLEEYARILHDNKSIDDAANAFNAIAGGSLVNDEGKITKNTRQFGFKKDFNDFKHYAYPIKITRVNKSVSNGDGYGKTKIAGTRYKIWIAKDDSAKGMPAPVSIILPAHGDPKVVNIGSY